MLIETTTLAFYQQINQIAIQYVNKCKIIIFTLYKPTMANSRILIRKVSSQSQDCLRTQPTSSRLRHELPLLLANNVWNLPHLPTSLLPVEWPCVIFFQSFLNGRSSCIVNVCSLGQFEFHLLISSAILASSSSDLVLSSQNFFPLISIYPCNDLYALIIIPLSIWVELLNLACLIAWTSLICGLSLWHVSQSRIERWLCSSGLGTSCCWIFGFI